MIKGAVNLAQKELHRVSRSQSPHLLVDDLELLPRRAVHDALMSAQDNSVRRATVEDRSDDVLEVWLLNEVIAFIEKQQDPTVNPRQCPPLNFGQLGQPRHVLHQTLDCGQRCIGTRQRGEATAHRVATGDPKAFWMPNLPLLRGHDCGRELGPMRVLVVLLLPLTLANHPLHSHTDPMNPPERARLCGICARECLQWHSDAQASHLQRKGPVCRVEYRRLTNTVLLTG